MIEIKSLYICVKNMERDIKFYEGLLNIEVTECNEYKTNFRY